MEAPKKGGKREGSGRKPTEDKKQPVCVYVYSSTVEKHGLANLKSKLTDFIAKLDKKK